MRVIAGELRGRTIRAPKGDATRPTTDRVRESLFSVLASRGAFDEPGARVLDAFAGSGALGIEALSRGAAAATFVERSAHALDALQRNLRDLGLESRARVVRGDALKIPSTRLGGAFSLILLDPPYTLDAAAISSLLTALVTSDALAEGAVTSWEHAADRPVTWPAGFSVVSEKRYGTTAIDIAVYEGGELES